MSDTPSAPTAPGGMDIGSLMQLLGGQQAPMKGGTPPAPQSPGMVTPWQQAAQQQVGNNAPAGMNTMNPLAGMLAAQGPQYRPGDTTWGQAGDRLLRYTPQEGNVRGGGVPPGQPAPGGPGTLPGSVTGPGGPVTIDWSKLGATLDANGTPVPVPAGNPPGDPKINAAMEKLKQPGPPAGSPEEKAMRQAGTTPPGFYQQLFGIPSGQSAPVTVTRGGGVGGKPITQSTVAPFRLPQTLTEYYNLDQSQRVAYERLYPGMQRKLEMVNTQPLKDQGLGPGAPTWTD